MYKFDISGNEDFYNTQLSKYIDKAGLQDVLKESNFVSYKDYYNDELTNFYKANSIFWGGILVALAIYVLLVVQTFILFIDSRMNEILVQLLLGFSKKDIFKTFYTVI